jgi:phage portal protein BeeE
VGFHQQVRTAAGDHAHVLRDRADRTSGRQGDAHLSSTALLRERCAAQQQLASIGWTVGDEVQHVESRGACAGGDSTTGRSPDPRA